MGPRQTLTRCEKEEARQKETIEDLKRTIEHYRSLAELSPDCIFIIDREFLIRYVNGAAARYLGKEPGELHGSPLKDFFPPASFRAQARHLLEVFGSGIAVTSFDRFSFPDIELFLNTKWIPLRDEAGSISSALCISRDISGLEPSADRELLQNPAPAALILSNREVQVLGLIADGMTNKEIADKLFISARTVDTHRSRMMKKLDAHNAAELIRKSRQYGLLS